MKPRELLTVLVMLGAAAGVFYARGGLPGLSTPPAGSPAIAEPADAARAARVAEIFAGNKADAARMAGIYDGLRAVLTIDGQRERRINNTATLAALLRVAGEVGKAWKVSDRYPALASLVAAALRETLGNEAGPLSDAQRAAVGRLLADLAACCWKAAQ